MAEETRNCSTCCKYQLNQDVDEEPCKSCNHFDKWEPMIEESTEPVLCKYFVRYSYKKDGLRYERGSILNSERLTHSANIEKLQLALEHINGFDEVCLIDWKELED